jgi:K(+)-stimulated pyrophosphate-energized sodium pump
MDIFGMGSRHGMSDFEQIAIVAVLITAFISLLYAWLLRGSVLKKDMGTKKMQEVWDAIRIGADSYLTRQLRTILPAIVLLAIALFLSVYVVAPSKEAVLEFGQASAVITIAIGRMIAFIVGASFSLLVGTVGHAHGDPGKRACCLGFTAQL